MARLLRALRLVTVLPKLQILVNALLRSIPSLGYVGILLLLHFYIYAVMGTFLFAQNDPIRFGRLQYSMTTLFQVLTLEGWNDVFNTQLLGSDVMYDDAMKNLPEASGRVNTPHPVAARAYFISFIMLGTMIMLNLFTGVIINAMQEAQVEPPVGDPDASLIHKIEKQGFVTLRDQLDLIGFHLRSVAADVSALKQHTGLPGQEPLLASQLSDGADASGEALHSGDSKDLRQDESQQAAGK
jgi:voltage-gated sodium channel